MNWVKASESVIWSCWKYCLSHILHLNFSFIFYFFSKSCDSSKSANLLQTEYIPPDPAPFPAQGSVCHIIGCPHPLLYSWKPWSSFIMHSNCDHLHEAFKRLSFFGSYIPSCVPLFFFFKIFIYYLFIMFIFGCVGSSFLCEGFLQLRRAGATLHRGARASHYRGLSCCGAEAPDAQAQ